MNRPNHLLLFSDHVEATYWRLFRDAAALLDSNVWCLAAKGVDESRWGWPIFAVLSVDYDDSGIRAILERYAKGFSIPKRLSYKKRWALAVRLKLASAVLYAYRKEQLGKDSPVSRFFRSLSEEDLVTTLTLDFAPVFHSLLSDYLALDSETKP